MGSSDPIIGEMIPFNPLSRRVAAHRKAMERALKGTLDQARFVLGPAVQTFEKKFASVCGVNYGVGVASGTEALWLALKALDVGPGDEVITVANTCAPTICAILQSGATPVLVDVDPVTLTMDPVRAARSLTRRTKCFLPVHLFGQCADMGPLKDLARRKGLFLVEDCAQAHGATYGGKPAGGMGDVGCYSFYPTKNLGGLGDGGMVVTQNAGLAEKIRLLREYGYRPRNHSVFPGYNSRLDEIQAAVLLVFLRQLRSWNRKRRAVARMYSQAFRGTAIVPPVEAAARFHVYHLYVVRVPQRDQWRARLLAQGVETAIHYPLPIHQQKGLTAHCRVGQGGLAQTEQAAREIVSLPIFPEILANEVQKVITAALSACG